MARITYEINKGINRSIVFRGLKGQYIWYAGGAMFTVMIAYALMYVLGINTYLCLLISCCLAAGSLMLIFQLSETYGEHGLLKAYAAKKIPTRVKATSRAGFISKSKNVTADGKAIR
ncbi:protein of unknown function [Dyadobacter soli]|uniref:DUF4133 domain-containing protein n=1 Tax=Dyadobacter soli TaxID=659014 RepID=A0A1G7MHM4_9BACT|nr:DUF4133 domain-containing protein [Dyadobacter soli]SDF61187.1 protein of unknown function [Dyadobacter soli]